MTDLNARPAPELGWGILGTGYIADLFAADLPAAAQGRVRAVASRDADRGRLLVHASGLTFDQDQADGK